MKNSDVSTVLVQASLALGVLFLFIILGLIVSFITKYIGRNKTLQTNRVYRLLAGSLNTAIIICGIIFALSILNVDVSALIAGFGLTGLALGIALKDAISNLVAGLLIIIYKPFDIGDNVEISGAKGRVVDVNLRYVSVSTENDCVLIPNQNCLTNVIRRNSRREESDKSGI